MRNFIILCICFISILSTLFVSAIPVGDSDTINNIINNDNIHHIQQEIVTPDADAPTEETPKPITPPTPSTSVPPEPIDPAECEHSFTPRPSIVTCTRPGGTTYTCHLCNYSYVKDYEPPHGHFYEAYEYPNTCDEEGYTKYICLWCKDSYTVPGSTKESHPYGGWQIIEFATPMSAGIHKRECPVCHHVEAEEYEVYAENNTLTSPKQELSIPFYYNDEEDGITDLPIGVQLVEYNAFVISGSTDVLSPFRRLSRGSYLYLTIDNMVHQYEIVSHTMLGESSIVPERDLLTTNDKMLYIAIQNSSTSIWLVSAVYVHSAPPITAQ